MALGEAKVVITATLDKLKMRLGQARGLVTKSLKRLSGGLIKGLTRSIGRMFDSLVRNVKRAAFVITAALVGIGIASTRAAQDAEETANLFKESFGGLAADVDKWTASMAKGLGLNRTNLRSFASTFNLIVTGLGVGAEEAASMSKELTSLVFDLASFRNLRVDEAFTKISAGLTGESEPLKRIGVIVNETTTKNEALAIGIIKQGETLTEVQKVMARYALIMRQTTKDQGDLQRTMNSSTNISKRFGATLLTIRETIGAKLNPSIDKIKLNMIDWLVNNEGLIGKWAESAGRAIERVAGFVTGLVEIFKRGQLGEFIKIQIDRIIQFLKDKAPDFKEAGISIGVAIRDGIADAIDPSTKRKGKFIGTGAVIGGLIGSVAGGVGAVPGAAAGAAVGSLISKQGIGNAQAFGAWMPAMVDATERNTAALERQNEVRE